MNSLSTDERKRVVAALVEGNSLRAVTRMTGVHRTTVMKLLCDLGRALLRVSGQSVSQSEMPPPPMRRNLVFCVREGKELFGKTKSKRRWRRLDMGCA